MNLVTFQFNIPGDDFTRAGEASSSVKRSLKQLGLHPEVIRKVAIAMYEGEINMVIHANGGTIDVFVTPQNVEMVLKDTGPGIADVGLAMKEGYSTAPDSIRSLGFGAGMGLPNMKKNTDHLAIDTVPGNGTTVHMSVNIPTKEAEKC